MEGERTPLSLPSSMVPACCRARTWAAPPASSGGTPSTSQDSLLVSDMEGLEMSEIRGLLACPVMEMPTSTGR